MINTPVIFIFFNKMDTTKRVFEQIKKAKPAKLYLISDGPRENKEGESERVESLRNWVESNIDWECQIRKKYAQQNMGCKMRIVSGISEVFEIEEQAIIIEDDCCPRDKFFEFCELMLETYKNDTNVMMINGVNQIPLTFYEMDKDYCFTKNVWVWGWATWKRAWNSYDSDVQDWPESKKNNFLSKMLLTQKRIDDMSAALDSVYENTIDTWDYQWCYCVWKNDGLAITPKYNLVDNLGFAIPEALHTISDIPIFLKKVFSDKRTFEKKIEITNEVVRNLEFDKAYDDVLLREEAYHKKFWVRVIEKIKSILK